MDDISKATECPKCGNDELGEGKQSGYATMQPVGGIIGSNIIYTICSNCGYIIEGYVSKPQKFKKR